MAYFLAQINERGISPTNHLRVSKSNAPIQGQYALDLCLPLWLESAFKGIPIKNGQPPNLYLETSGGPITAEVWIIPDVKGKSRQAVLDFTNRSGSVQVEVVRLTQNYPTVNNYEGRESADMSKIALPRRLEWPTSESHYRHIFSLWRRLRFSSAFFPWEYHHSGH